MESKNIIQGLILILIVSLTCAAIYAVETGEVSHEDSTSGESNLYISGSGDVSQVVDSFTPNHGINKNPFSFHI